VLRKFYTTQSAGKTLLREAGFVKPNGEIMPFHVDHIYSLSSKNSAGRGIDHVSNFYLLSEPQNVLFSDNPELQRVKLDCIGEVARRAATQLDSYVTQCINRGVPVDDETLGSFRAVGRQHDKGKTLSPYAFVSLFNTNPVIAEKPACVQNSLVYMQAAFQNKAQHATFRTHKSSTGALSKFVDTQHVNQAGTDSSPLQIDVRACTIKMWPHRDVDGQELGDVYASLCSR
jgi:hypothetical protein